MVYLVIVLIVVIIGLLIYIYRMHCEIHYISEQLKVIQEGSHIQLTSQVHTNKFNELYERLDMMLNEYQEKQFKLLKAEEQLKMTVQNMAHDLRTPLTSSMGYMHMLKESCDELKKQRYLNISLERMEELKKMLEELFLYTKLISDAYILECEKMTVYPILTNTLISFYHFFEKSGQEPIVQFADESVVYHVNKDAIERIFRNIINNAFVHGIGDLRIQQKNHTIIFQNTIKPGDVIDTEHVFERFYKGDQSRNHTSSGLGLAIVKELVEKMDGAVFARVGNDQFILELILKE